MAVWTPVGELIPLKGHYLVTFLIYVAHRRWGKDSRGEGGRVSALTCWAGTNVTTSLSPHSPLAGSCYLHEPDEETKGPSLCLKSLG